MVKQWFKEIDCRWHKEMNFVLIKDVTQKYIIYGKKEIMGKDGKWKYVFYGKRWTSQTIPKHPIIVLGGNSQKPCKVSQRSFYKMIVSVAAYCNMH